MAQKHLKFGTYTPTDPDSDGYQYRLQQPLLTNPGEQCEET